MVNFTHLLFQQFGFENLTTAYMVWQFEYL